LRVIFGYHGAPKSPRSPNPPRSSAWRASGGESGCTHAPRRASVPAHRGPGPGQQWASERGRRETRGVCDLRDASGKAQAVRTPGRQGGRGSQVPQGGQGLWGPYAAADSAALPPPGRGAATDSTALPPPGRGAAADSAALPPPGPDVWTSVRPKMSDPRVIFEQTSKTTGHPSEFRFE
jgi:hypothetical protein